MRSIQLPKRFLDKYPEFDGKVKALRYARNDLNEPVGVVLMDFDGNVGISVLNTHMGDKWDMIKGIRKALYRTGQRKTLRDRLVEFAVRSGNSPSYEENANFIRRALVAIYKEQTAEEKTGLEVSECSVSTSPDINIYCNKAGEMEDANIRSRYGIIK